MFQFKIQRVNVLSMHIYVFLKTHLTSKLYEMLFADLHCSTSLNWSDTPTLDVGYK